MSLESQYSQDNWHREAQTIAVRNSIRTRRWGMRITVYNDPTPANNGEWVLTYNNVSTNRQDNGNFLKVADIGQTWGGGGGGGSTSAKSQAFAFTGIQSSFTVNNGTLDQINFVEVNGVVQIEGTNYTVTGQVVDFGSNLPGAGTVVVYYFESLSVGVTPDLEAVLTAGNDAAGIGITDLPSITSSASFTIDAVTSVEITAQEVDFTMGTVQVEFTTSSIFFNAPTGTGGGSIFISPTSVTIDNTSSSSDLSSSVNLQPGFVTISVSEPATSTFNSWSVSPTDLNIEINTSTGIAQINMSAVGVGFLSSANGGDNSANLSASPTGITAVVQDFTAIDDSLFSLTPNALQLNLNVNNTTIQQIIGIDQNGLSMTFIDNGGGSTATYLMQNTFAQIGPGLTNGVLSVGNDGNGRNGVIIDGDSYMINIPTSPIGLFTGQIYSNAGVLTLAP